jgi:prepilin peptidase CpaA
VNDAIWVVALVFALGGGWMDWRSRRLPNWWTVSGLAVGLVLNAVLLRWPGAKGALLGAGLGLVLLFPFVWLRAMGAGDWKFVGALGALLGPAQLLVLLWVAVITAGVMAVIAIVRRRRVRETLVNLGRLFFTFITLGWLGGAQHDVSLDNPNAVAVPFGVAVAVATVVCFAGRFLVKG